MTTRSETAAKGRKRPPSEPDVASLVLEMLLKALQSGGEARLVATDVADGLLPGETASLHRAAIRTCLDELKLLRITRAGTKRDRSGARFVTVTPAGVEHVLRFLEPARVEALMQEIDPETCAKLAEAAVRQAEGRLGELQAQLRDAVTRAEGVVGAFLEKVTTFADRMEDEMHEARSRMETWRARLGRRAGGYAPMTEQEGRSVRELAQNMVFAWEEALGTGAAGPIERALFNAGVEQIGEPGERITFTARLHDCETRAIPGAAVEVVRPGWLLRDARGEYLLAPAKVKPVPSNS